MATERPPLIVTLTPTALRHLDEIWDWNAESYGADHAQNYVDFLRGEAAKLDARHDEGKPTLNPQYRYVTLRRGRKEHGHIAVYGVTLEAVEVLAFYRTAQDWRSKIDEHRP